ncbi:MAG: dTDP-4-dehydrorhamnose 3,5-epimerase [Rhodocyclaceae bacterium]|nr:MAG: dTDP-4-dehydrorhamnose 3,5-epimerase [Rhodocyclaceae bacterium]
MDVIPTQLPDVLIIGPQVVADDHGIFFESLKQKALNHAAGLNVTFEQENHSKSKKKVRRGLRGQVQELKCKLVLAVQGAVFNVAVDVCRGNSSFGRWAGEFRSTENKRQKGKSGGFAYGFLTLSETAELLYVTTDYYMPLNERFLAWDDGELALVLPICGVPAVSSKDTVGRLHGDLRGNQ